MGLQIFINSERKSSFVHSEPDYFAASPKRGCSRSLFRTSSSATDCILTFSLDSSVPTLRRFCHLYRLRCDMTWTSRTNNLMESFYAALGWRIKVSHPNLFAFLGHLQHTTVDNQADISHLTRGMTIRRMKRRKYILNDIANQGLSVRRFDDNVYTRLDFLKAVSHCMGAHSSDLHCVSKKACDAIYLSIIQINVKKTYQFKTRFKDDMVMSDI